MNHENLKTLIDTIKDADEKGMFDISVFSHPCGSPACIAGYAAELLGRVRLVRPSFVSEDYSECYGNYSAHYTHALQEYLEITQDEAREISMGFEDLADFSPNVEQAIEFLEAFSANQSLSWFDMFEDEIEGETY